MKLICRNNFQQQRRPKCGMQWSFEEVTCKWAADRSVGVGDAEGCGDDELCTASGRSSGHGETDWGWDGPLSSVTSWSSPPGQLPPARQPKLITAPLIAMKKLDKCFKNIALSCGGFFFNFRFCLESSWCSQATKPHWDWLQLKMVQRRSTQCDQNYPAPGKFSDFCCIFSQ